MLAYEHIVNINDCLPVHCAEMQKQAITLRHLGKVEASLIPQCIFIADHTAHTRKRRLYAIRNEYLSVRNKAIRLGRSNCIIPQTVEIDPGRSYHLRSRILRQRC